MRRLMLLVAAGSLWLFLAALPVLADGGPHVSDINSGTSSLTADSCAGCHRAHTAQGEFLLATQSEETLCLSCHGGGISDATTDVENGVQFVPSGSGTRTSVELGALRDGGYLKARIDTADPSRMSYPRGWENSPLNTEFAVSQRPKVGVLSAAEAATSLGNVRSAHIDLGVDTAGIADTGTVWGKGTTGLGTTGVTDMTCVECHNPHGNDQYRILRPVPGIEADPLGEAVPVDVKATYANFDTIVTDGQHGLTVNDVVTLTGVGGLADNDYVVAVVTNGFTFRVAASGTTTNIILTLSDTTNAGTVLRSEVAIADYPVDPDNDGVLDTKNYTVIQTKGSQGVDASFLLYAQDVIDARGGGGIAADQLAVDILGMTTTGSSAPFTYWFDTDGAHGLAVGDLVDLSGGPWGLTLSNPYTVASIGSAGGPGALYDRFTVVNGPTSEVDSTGDVVRKGIPGDYSAIGGDYFRRLVPWNPALVNPSCSNSVFSTANSAYCGVMNDAPNGRPNAITAPSSGTGPDALFGQQAFLDQASTWCMQCHTRYYSASNENDGSHPIISTIEDRGIGRFNSNQIYPLVYENSAGPPPVRTQYGGPAYGDKVTFKNTGSALDAGEWWVTATGGSGTGSWFKVSDTKDGSDAVVANEGASPYTTSLATFTKVFQSSNSSWGYPRDDATYKYQHSTASNRGCTVCHVAHGSNAAMPGEAGTTWSPNVPYPDGTTISSSSRLLKIDNRGTCQACHDPTGTIVVGTLLPNPGGSTSVP